jgi:hypothetical protein
MVENVVLGHVLWWRMWYWDMFYGGECGTGTCFMVENVVLGHVLWWRMWYWHMFYGGECGTGTCFMVENVVLGHVFIKYFCFPLSVPFCHNSVLISIYPLFLARQMGEAWKLSQKTALS